MERFTFFTDDYPAVTCDSCYEDQNENYTGPAIDRLAEYEATGLMPAEVAALAQELKYAKQQCREDRRWIPVTERLPERDKEVLLIVHGWKDRLYYTGCLHRQEAERSWLTGIESKASDWKIWGFSYLREPIVTNWMPLPEPPKEETP